MRSVFEPRLDSCSRAGMQWLNQQWNRFMLRCSVSFGLILNSRLHTVRVFDSADYFRQLCRASLLHALPQR